MPLVVLITGPQDINKYLPYITGTVEASEQWGGGGGGEGENGRPDWYFQWTKGHASIENVQN